PRARRVLRAPGPGGGPEPGAADRHAVAGDAGGPRVRLRARRAHRTDLRDDAGGRAPRRPALPPPLSARTVGWPAAADRPGHRLRMPSPGDRVGRTDHRPGRDYAGPRP